MFSDHFYIFFFLGFLFLFLSVVVQSLERFLITGRLFKSRFIIIIIIITSQETEYRELREFYQKMKTFAQADPGVFVADYELQKSKVLGEKYASFTGVVGLYEAWTAAHCDVYRLPEVYMSTPLGLFLQKGSPYYVIFSKE